MDPMGMFFLVAIPRIFKGFVRWLKRQDTVQIDPQASTMLQQKD
jgi:hypothetical protein